MPAGLLALTLASSFVGCSPLRNHEHQEMESTNSRTISDYHSELPSSSNPASEILDTKPLKTNLNYGEKDVSEKIVVLRFNPAHSNILGNITNCQTITYRLK
jgi:hypothetical protein